VIRDFYNRWLMEETPRKYTKPTYTKNDQGEDPRPDGKMMQRIRKMGIVNWRQEALNSEQLE
jgi:hypothetical protein